MSGNGQSVTLATNTYDQTSLVSQTGLTAHDSNYGTGWATRGNLTQSVTPGAIRNTQYDIGGMPVKADDGYGHTLTINSSSATNYAAPTSLLPNNSSTYQNTYTYNPSLSPASATDPNNNTATNSYDSYGRLATSTTMTGMQTTYAYDYTQQTIGASAAPTWWPIGTPAHWSQTQTDGFGRTVRSQAGASSTSVLSIVDSQYAPCACSPLGKLSAVSAPYAPGATPVWTRYTYDGSGRTLTVTAPDGVSVTAYTYQGNRTTITDPAGNWKTYTSDANGNLTQVTEPGNLITSYSHDVLNHLTQVTMTRGVTPQTRTFTYDSVTQRLVSVQTPEAGAVQYVYNNDGTLQYKTDALGQKAAYRYDALARVSEASYSPANSAPDPCQQVNYNYDSYPYGDAFSNTLAYPNSPIGRLTGSIWGGASAACPYQFYEEYAYDAQGKVFARALNITNTGNPAAAPLVLTSYFLYDAEGRLTVATYPAGTSLQPTQTITYTTDHDALGRDFDMYTGTPGSPSWVVSSATYNAAGRLTQMYSNQFSETRTYNANLQLTSISATPTGGGSGINLSYAFPSANNGRISQMTDNLSGETVQYTYDQLNRLLSAASSTVGTMNFAYDGFGNLTQQGSTTLSVDATTNRINTSGYQYNANGDLVGAPGGTAYAYDVSNRLVSNGAIYNPRNQRVFDGTYFYLYTPGGRVLGKYTALWSQGTSQAVIVGQPNVYFAGRLLQEQGHWVMVDRLGSVRKSGTGESSEFNPYGDERTPLTSDGRTKFAGYFRDANNLDYADQRYYTPGPGRFMTPDPGGMRTARPGNPTTWNRYAYVVGDPVNHRDRTGLYVDLDGADDTDYSDDGGCDDLTTKYQAYANPCEEYGGGEDFDVSGPTLIPCSVSAQSLESYMLNTKAYNAKGLPIASTTAARPLAAFASTIMADAVADNVDPRLLVAIAFVETKFGALNCAGVPNTNNPFCLGDQKPFVYSGGIGDAIQAAADNLAGKIGPTTTVASLYNPTSGQSGYCNTSECTPTAVNTRLMQQGGGIGLPGVYGPLQSPCYLGSDGIYYQKQ